MQEHKSKPSLTLLSSVPNRVKTAAAKKVGTFLRTKQPPNRVTDRAAGQGYKTSYV